MKVLRLLLADELLRALYQVTASLPNTPFVARSLKSVYCFILASASRCWSDK
jgi:hypothetical protein